MGQFTLWNGLKFNFDTILPAHEFPIRRMIWKYDDEILVSSDSRGFIKYWTMNMKNLINKRGHDESINDMVFSPTYCKFASASADGYLKVWDFSSCKTELATRGHGWDVTCIDWHPYKSIIASGSKDNLIKLWCPRSGECVRSLHGHKNTVSCLKINKINGNWLISGSKDQLIKVWDLRMLNKGEFDTIRAEIDELSCLSWHPHYEKLYVAGGKSGDIKYFLIGNSRNKLSGGNKSYSCQAEIHKAHEQIIWDFAWHPLGHILASSSNDQTTRFWTRNRPGDDMNDQYNVNQLTGPSKQAALRQLAIATKHNPLGTGRTTKPLTEIGGVNLEEIINTEENENMEQDNNPKINPQHPSIANDPLLADNYNMPTNIHPERMRQMGGASKSNQSQSRKPPSSMGLPGMGAHIPTMPPPPSHMGPPPTQPPPYGQQPPMHHSSYPPPHHQPPHLGPPPMQQAPPYGQQPPRGPPGHNPYLSMQGGPNDRDRYDRRDRGRDRMDRDRDRGRDRRDRRRRDRSRSRERDRDRKSKKGSAVPGLSRIPGLSFGK